MKMLFLFSILFLSSSLFAQKVTDASVVKDSSGTVYPKAVWQHLMMKGGYILRPENKNDPSTAFYLVRLSEEEKAARFARMPAPRESKFFTKGKKINLGKVRDIEGNKIDLKENGGKITVVNFWFINCPPCRMEIPDLNLLVDKYASDSVRFVGIALDSKYDLDEFLRSTPFKYKIVDEGRNIAQGEGVQSYPTHVIIDQEGKVYFHTTGLAPNTVYWLEKCIKELQAKTNTASASIQ